MPQGTINPESKKKRKKKTGLKSGFGSRLLVAIFRTTCQLIYSEDPVLSGHRLSKQCIWRYSSFDKNPFPEFPPKAHRLLDFCWWTISILVLARYKSRLEFRLWVLFEWASTHYAVRSYSILVLYFLALFYRPPHPLYHKLYFLARKAIQPAVSRRL